MNTEASLFPEIDATPEIVARTPPPRGDRWIVLAVGGACIGKQGWWEQPRQADELYSSRELAEKASAELSSYWTHIRLVRIPGEQ